MPTRTTSAAVAASGQWTDPDGVRMPSGEAHAWLPGRNQTLCGLALSRSRLVRFPHVGWADVQPATGRDADEVARVCPRCSAAITPRSARGTSRRWSRTDPRP